MAFPLLQYMATLDGARLPRILRVCSGVYFQGSVYEISGNEVCFSTGDVIKVTAIELSSVCCEDVGGGGGETFELPVNHTGLLKAIPEASPPYGTLEEVVKGKAAGSQCRLPVTFTSLSEVTLADVTLEAGAVLTLLSVAEKEQRCRCRLRPAGPGRPQAEAEVEVDVPLGTRGQFYERFTPREIVTSTHLRSRRFRFHDDDDDAAAACQRTLVLSPVYQICAIMSLRKDVLRFPSSLAVDVVDITETCQGVSFVTPLSLPEVHSQSDQSFPVVVEVLEAPEFRSMIKSAWLPQLQQGVRLIFHGRTTSPMTVVSSGKSCKAQRYFLVSERYAGRFRRRPRGFDSAYELYAAAAQTPGLRVSVTRDCEEAEEGGLPGLSVGERLEVVACQKVQLPCGRVDAVVCVRLRDADDGDGDDDDDDDDEEDDEVGAGRREARIYLPLYMQGHFVELLSDNKKYALKALGEKLPLDVKAVSRDPGLKEDPLVGFPSLRLAGVTLEPTVRASFLHAPHLCFEIPTRRLCMSVCRTQQPLPWPPTQAPKCTAEPVTEVTDRFWHHFQKEALPLLSPPPRPPKRCPAAAAAAGANTGVPTRDFGNMTIARRGSSSLPLLPPTAAVGHRPPTGASGRFLTPRTSVQRATPDSYVGAVGSNVTGPACEDEAVENDDDYYEQVEEDTSTATLNKDQESVGFF